MEILGASATDAELIAAVRRWVGLLAADDFEAAVRFLWQGEGAGSMAVSASSLREWLGRYEPAPPLSTARPARVTAPETAGGPFDPLEEVFRRDDGTVSSVDFSLPFNGEWSELVAFFDVVDVPGGQALKLRDIYIT
ncbi:hypothetical protein [Allorhizocola rhizosphaerae]|uniref:hypothetical protein n=1 Tax=Allorhizocola rhizosphaerae TaxID=1872709 RepID=UPI000E3DC658|nr:hypothetical protein [Allorhizocola rhizosphaerae]